MRREGRERESTSGSAKDSNQPTITDRRDRERERDGPPPRSSESDARDGGDESKVCLTYFYSLNLTNNSTYRHLLRSAVKLTQHQES